MRHRWIVLAALAAVVGCDALGGKGKDKSSLLPSEFGAPDHARVDPDYRYKRAHLSWQANHHSIVEGMDNGSPLQINEAYKAVKNALGTMRRYLPRGAQDQLDGFLAQYERIMGYVTRGNYNTAVHGMLDSLEDKVDKSLSPGMVTTVVPEGEAYAMAPQEARPEPEPKTMDDVSPVLGAPTAGPAYRQSYEAWQSLNGELMERLYSTTPRVDDLHPRILAAIDGMAPALPSDLKEALGHIRAKYDGLLMSIQTQGVQGDMVERVAEIQRLMEKDFAPEKVSTAQPKPVGLPGTPRK
ncbi:MAG: hypothetical protein AAB434_05515 [Planctomycetota bacterium]